MTERCIIPVRVIELDIDSKEVMVRGLRDRMSSARFVICWRLRIKILWTVRDIVKKNHHSPFLTEYRLKYSHNHMLKKIICVEWQYNLVCFFVCFFLWLLFFFSVTLCIYYYRIKHCFLGNYLCINSGSSLTNWIKSEGFYVKFVSELPEFIHT